MSIWSLTYQQSVFKRYHSDIHFSEFLPTRWRKKTTGIDMEQNYVTVTLYILSLFGIVWPVVLVFTLSGSRVRFPPLPFTGNNFGWVIHKHIPLLAKQHKLVPAKGRWRPAAGKVTAGLTESTGSRRQVCTCVDGLSSLADCLLYIGDQHWPLYSRHGPLDYLYFF